MSKEERDRNGSLAKYRPSCSVIGDHMTCLADIFYVTNAMCANEVLFFLYRKVAFDVTHFAPKKVADQQL